MQISRRNLLSAGMALSPAPLIGTARAKGNYLPEAVSGLRGSRKSATIPTHEGVGEIQERLDFPGDWEIHEMKMAGHDAPALPWQEVVRRLENPVGGRPLKELAAGKKSAVITFDDSTRPTPIASVAPLVVEQLKAGGIAENNIFFLGSTGAHRTVEQDEVVKKLGTGLAQRHTWFNHDTFEGLTEVGETSFKNRVWINKLFLGADLRITISGVKIHSIAGYGGGAKAVLPGVAGLQTIRYNHDVIAKNNKTAGEGKIFKNELRRDMVEAARLAKVDFSVQIVYNNRLEPCRIFAGDIEHAHVEACRASHQLHRTPTYSGADVVVANSYPQASQGAKVQAWVNRSVREGGTGIIVLQHPVGIMSWHYLWPTGYSGSGGVMAALTPRSPVVRKYQLIVFSQYHQKALERNFAPGTIFATRWEDVVKTLMERHKTASRVAVYPHGSLQHQGVEFDG